MIRKVKTYFAEVLSTLRSISDGLKTQTAATVELTAAVKDAAGRVDRQTVALDYLAASERTKNHRQGVQVQ